ncbi:MAG: Co2+/Mg2+ efflux protein ApaG [Porticoccaceae bacterium]|jgi:ApaG protein|nr:Co2+/Mg2+ efflux protein ApaG [Porticoccaceae bacterium]
MTDAPIQVEVRTQYLGEQSRPDKNHFAFAYHITIANRGAEPWTLISRHWIIVDGDNKRQEVRGDGVVGAQPTIAPGDHYSYTSGVVLATPVGTMEGSYHFVGDGGQTLDAPITPFLLAVPGSIN